MSQEMTEDKKGKGRYGLFKVTPRRIGVGGVIRSVLDIEAGAIVVFIGTVRRLSRGREIEHLEYESYREMAVREFERIAVEIKNRWNVRRIAIVHRTGRLRVGEVSVVIAISASHREEAYRASRYAIERLKESVPIWKKEVWEGGEEWIEGA
jgi:molybdopterin synthase catalytic subunit